MDFWAVGLDGWMGALVSAAVAAVVTIVVANRVLLRTLTHERELLREEQRMGAFAELCAALQAVGAARGPAALVDASTRAYFHFEMWKMYLRAEHRPFAYDVGRAIRTCVRQADEWGAVEVQPSPTTFVQDVGLEAAVRYIIQWGTDWHADESRRHDIEQWFRGNFSVEEPDT